MFVHYFTSLETGVKKVNHASSLSSINGDDSSSDALAREQQNLRSNSNDLFLFGFLRVSTMLVVSHVFHHFHPTT
jgi:hypothetical protein